MLQYLMSSILGANDIQNYIDLEELELSPCFISFFLKAVSLQRLPALLSGPSFAPTQAL